MIGAVAGDIAGSVYEFHNIKTKKFNLFKGDEFFTDDSVMTFAVAKALMGSLIDGNWEYKRLSKLTILYMQIYGNRYPGAGYGGMFAEWLRTMNPLPYNSFGNGSAMRVSPCGFVARSLEEAKKLSEAVTKVTHNHPEGIKGAEATAVCIYLARQKKSIEEIKQYIDEHYYRMDFTLDEIRPRYYFNETCQETVPQALMAFFESTSFEDAIRNAISIGGDSDTLAAITGGVAEAYYGIDERTENTIIGYLDDNLKEVLHDWSLFLDKLK